MTKKNKKSEAFELWKSRIASKRTQMESLESSKGWDRLKKYYRNMYEEALQLKIPIVKINEVYAFVRTSVSSLFVRYPRIRIAPTKKEDLIPAKVAENAVNYYWRNKQIKRQVKKALKEGKLVGYSWIMVGYEAEIDSYDDEKGNTNEFIKNDDVFVIHVPYNKIWYDFDAQDPPYDCKWFIRVYDKPTNYLRKKYNNDKIMPTLTRESMISLKEVDSQRTRCYEIYDKNSEEIKTYIEGLDDFAETKDWDGDSPFAMIVFDEYIDLDEGDNLPSSEILAFEPQILEKMKIRSMQMEHIKRYNRQLVMDTQKVTDEDEKERLKKGEISNIVEVNGDPNSVFAAMPYPPVQQDAYAVENLIVMDKDRISGQSAIEQGGSAVTRTRTLGEIEQITQATAGRNAEQQDIVENFLTEISRKILRLMQKHFDTPRLISISGTISRPIVEELKQRGKFNGMGIEFTKEDIQGDFIENVRVVSGSSLPLNTQVRTQKILEMARFGQVFGLTPGSFASMQLGKDMMEENELLEVSLAYDMDIQRMLAPKEPSPEEKLKMATMQMNLAKGKKSLEVADNRMESNNQSTLKKAIDNSRSMSGEEHDLKIAQQKKNLTKSDKSSK